MKKLFLLSILMCFFAAIVHAQTRKITGQVVNAATGKPIAGASVVVNASNKGAVTDENGNFSVNVPAKGKVTLAVSFTGYTLQEIPVTTENNLLIKLTEEVKELSDVVVVGYGTVKKKDLTGAVASIKTEDIVRSNPTNAEKAMQGQFAGVNITKASNLPGQAFSMDIRGESTITGVTEPLVVIDGIVGGRIQDINPADIQSIDILKDASSTAIYGSRGANGVVIITSKKGRSGRAKVSIDSYIGEKVPAHLPQFQTAQQFYQSQYTDVILNNGTPATFTSNELAQVNSGKSTDWVAAVTKPAMQTGHTVAVTGGNAGTTYRFSGGYLQEDGNLPSTWYKRYSLNGALDSRINDFIRVGFTAYINYSDNHTSSLETLRSAYRARPTGVEYYSDLVNPSDGYDLSQGPWNGYAVWMGIKDNQVLNPVVEGDPANGEVLAKVANQMGNAFAEITLMKGLTFKTSISASNIDTRTGDYRGTYTKDRAGVNLPRATYSTADITSWTLDNQLSYDYSKGKSKINATAVQSAYKSKTENYSIAVQNLPYASYWYNLGTAGLSNITSVSSSYVQNTLESFMGRINYSYDDKYLITLTGRGDGASQLANNNKWAFFPSGAIAWRVAQEKFFKENVNAFSDLKLRLSYGQVGNANVSPYSTQAQVLNTIYAYDQTVGNGFAPGTLGNQDLKWERSEELNIGLDMGFLKNRITGTIELYKRNTKDLILQENLPTSSGFSVVTANVGKISNKGIEVLVNTQNINSKDFSWSTTINFSRNINRIEALANGVNAIIGNALFVGKSVKSYYDYKFDGIWQISDSVQAASFGQKPGQVRVVDENKDGVISSATGKDDRVVLGTQLPKFTIGMTNRFTYKDFDLSCFMYLRNGTMFMNGLFGGGTMADYTNNRYNHIVLNYWTRNNPTNDMYGVGITQPYKNAIAYQYANFLRISDITVGYTMPKAKLDKFHIDRLRVYAQLTNPFIFTKYKGLDPEYNGSGGYIDDVPNMIYTFGVNLGF
ncbi:MAG TPA: TonB-dependent receptor [Chitinophagaceae bacterium]|nr:TonB-dependent receptor [Chitinophagaceae bacterium]